MPDDRAPPGHSPSWAASAAEAAAHCARDPDGSVSHLLLWWRWLFPAEMKRDGDALEWHLRAALRHCRMLDAHASDAGAEGGFLLRFLGPVVEGAGFFAALSARARVPHDRKASHPLRAAVERGEDGQGAFALMGFRELLRDGWSVADALRLQAEEIGAEFARGNVELLLGLAASAKRPPRKSLHDWVSAAWLPLALWQPVPPEEKEARLRRAYDTLRKAEAVLPPWPRATAANPYPVAKILGTVASRIRHGKR